LNFFGGIVALIWLGMLGEWSLLGLGVGLILLGAFSLGFALLPSLVLAMPLQKFEQSGNKVGLFTLGFISSVYTNGVLTAWCIGILYIFVKDATTSNYIPSLLLAYTVATTPINYMAQKEQQGGDGSFALISAMFAQFAFLTTVGALLFFNVTLIHLVIVFASVMLLNVISQFVMATNQVSYP